MRLRLLIILLFNYFLIFAQTNQSLFEKQSCHEWSYQGDYGPDHWVELDPTYHQCGGGHQSPINIISSKSFETAVDIEFHYHPFFVDLINDGHTLLERIIEPKALILAEIEYTLLQFHFHTPSEHHLDGEEFPMEIHFVHQNAFGNYAVVAVLIREKDEDNVFLSHFMKTLPTHINEEIKSNERADPIEAMPANYHKFFYYTGSLTTPPCTEGIRWVVLENPVGATKFQIESIHKIIHNDNRPIQKLNDRVVYHHSGN